MLQLLTSQNPVFFQPNTRISIQKFSLNQYMEFMISTIYNGTAYKKELIQRNMNTKILLLNGIKKQN